MHWMDVHWGELAWTPWVSFLRPSDFSLLPAGPGMYRIRARDGDALFYLGETGRSLRGRLGDLRRNTMRDSMPYNDPHTAAPSLWAWRHAEGLEFECSAAPVTLADQKEEARKLREGLEFYLLWQYRLETGTSTWCNHGRFHPRYKKSTDRKKGFQGHRLTEEEPDNPAGGLSTPPLQLAATPLAQNWMGLAWSADASLSGRGLPPGVPQTPGVYRIVDPDTETLLYVGETGNLRSRLKTHAAKDWQRQTVCFSYVALPEQMLAYQRHEIENDLLGGFYAQTGTIPLFQLVDHH